MGGSGMGGGMGGMGVNPYANFNNDYEELEPTPLDPGVGNSRFPYGQMGGSMQAQLQAQAQLQTQQLQQLQQRQQQHHQQQQAQLQSQAQNMASHVGSNNNISLNQRSSLRDGNKRRPDYARENSEQSLNLGSAFEDTIEHGALDSGTGTDKHKQKMGGSQMSIMSLTVSELDGNDDVGVAGDLSAMFDSSLQISDKRVSNASTGSSLNANASALDRRRSDGESKAGLLDMSVATIGNDMSTVGGLSSALGGEIEDSHADMSFSHMFDDSEKNNV